MSDDLAGAIERKARELGVWRDEHDGLNDEPVTVCPYIGRDPRASFEVRTKVGDGPMWLDHAHTGAYLLAHESRRTIPWGNVREDWTLADAVMVMRSTPEELHYAGIQRAHHRDRPTATVYIEQMMAIGDPLGEVLALWLAGKLEARHVLGIKIVDIRVGWHGHPYERPALVALAGAS